MAQQDEVAVVVPAAGRGTRLGGRRKQFRVLGGRPLVLQTLLVFERHPAVQHLVIAGPADGDRALEELLHEARLTKLRAVVPGGASRRESVAAALERVPPAAQIVLVHDAVRPFVQAEHVSELVRAVRETGAAALAVPVVDTVRRGTAGLFAETVPREGLYRMQTPQGFRRDWLEEGHARAESQDVNATDDVELVQRCGHDVAIVPGWERNIKITTPGDWELAQALWEELAPVE